MRKKILAWVCVLAMLVPLTASGIETLAVPGNDTAIHSIEAELPEEILDDLNSDEEQLELDEEVTEEGVESPDIPVFLEEEEWLGEDEEEVFDEDEVQGQDASIAAVSEPLSTPVTLASWTFTSTTQVGGHLTIPATSGTFSSSIFGLVGAGTGLTAGSNGQLFCSGWDNASDSNQKYWKITTSSTGYSALEVSFGAHGSNTGPKNFVLEISYGDGWHIAGTYALMASAKTYQLSLPQEASNKSELSLRFRAADTIAINGTTVASTGTSRMYNVEIIGISGVDEEAPVEVGYDDFETALSQWVFTSKNQFGANLTAKATGGRFSNSTLAIVGGGTNLDIGTKNNAGQIYCGGWDNVSDDNQKYWHIKTSSEGYGNLNLTFGAHGSNTGPRNFVLEMKTDDEWTLIEQYALTGTAQMFSINLPSDASDMVELELRLRVTNTVAIGGATVASGGTTRLYDVTFSGVSTDIIDSFYELQIVQGQDYMLSIKTNDVASFSGKTFTFVYDPTALQLIDFAVQTDSGIPPVGNISGTPITIISVASGKVAFRFDKEIPSGFAWSGVITLLKFNALTTAKTALIVA